MSAVELPVKSLRTFTGYAILILLVLGLPVVRTPAEIALLLLAIVALAAAALPVFLRRDYNLLEPATALMLMVFFGVTLKVLYILWFAKTRSYVSVRLLNDQPPDVLVYGTLLMAISLLCFSIGYLVPLRFRAGPMFMESFTNWNRKRLLCISFLLLVVSIVFTVLFMRTVGAGFGSMEQLSGKRFVEEGVGSSSRIHKASYYYYRLAAFSKFAYFLSLAWLVKERRRFASLESIIICVSLAQLTLLYVVLQSRASIVLMCLDTLVITFFLTRRLKIVRFAIAIGAVFGLLVLLLGVRFRSTQTPLDLVEKTLTGRDLLDVTKTCHIINAIPTELPYRYGETMVGWVFAPIPKSIWRSKPMWADRGVTIMRYVYGDKLGYTSIEPGLIAETYWNFGWLGIAPIMLMLGIALRSFYEAFCRHQQVNGVLIYAVLLNRFVLFSFGLSLGTGILKAALDVIPLALMIMVVGFRAPSRAAVHARPTLALAQEK